jgi:hypothetical protein
MSGGNNRSKTKQNRIRQKEVKLQNLGEMVRK